MAVGIAPRTRVKARPEQEPTIEGGGDLPLYHLTVEQYLAMIASGVLGAGDRVELLGGLLVEKMVKNSPHNFGVGQTATALRALLPIAWVVREEKSVVIDAWSRPEPDVAVVRGPSTLYRDRDPKAREIALIVEVSDSTYSEDRGAKWRHYAAAKIPVYAIPNIQGRRLEVYRKPWGRGDSARYRESETFDEAAEFPVVIDGRELGRIAVKDVLA